MTFMPRLLFLVIVLIAPTASARDSDASLSLIQSPNNARPVIVRSGDTFTAVLTKRAELSVKDLQSELKLDAVWKKLPDGAFEAECSVPDSVSPGTYALVANSSSVKDSISRSVFVVTSFPDSYAVAHIGSVQSDKNLEGIVASLNSSKPAFAVFTGDFGGSAEKYKQFLDVLDKCNAPTFVLGGTGDAGSGEFNKYFLNNAHFFRFGLDGYILFDTTRPFSSYALDEQNAYLQTYRRIIKPSRWSVGFSHRYSPQMNMRAQIVLFVDNPLDYIIFGELPKPPAPNQQTFPWGKTEPLKPASAGKIEFVHVSQGGISDTKETPEQ